MQDKIKSFSILMNALLLLNLFILLSAGKQDRRSTPGGITGVGREPFCAVYSENFLDGPVFDIGEIEPWISSMLEDHLGEETRNFSGKDLAFVEETLDTYLDSLSENSLQCSYEVDRMTYSLVKKLSHITVRMRIVYIGGIVPYRDLASFSAPADAAEYLAGEWDEGIREIWFRCGNDWNGDTLYNTGNAAEMNTADTAALPSSFNYMIEERPGEEEKLSYIELVYSVDEKRLNARSQELKEELDRIASEILSRGLTTDQELYDAVSQIILDRADYDHDSIPSIYADNRSEEEWINSSAYGALISGKTICTGYAMAHKALCDRLGLPCWVISGNIKGAGHAWNMIRLDGKTYYVDCTSADSTGNRQYLLMDTAALSERGYYMPANQVCPW